MKGQRLYCDKDTETAAGIQRDKGEEGQRQRNKERVTNTEIERKRQRDSERQRHQDQKRGTEVANDFPSVQLCTQ